MSFWGGLAPRGRKDRLCRESRSERRYPDDAHGTDPRRESSGRCARGRSREDLTGGGGIPPPRAAWPYYPMKFQAADVIVALLRLSSVIAIARSTGNTSRRRRGWLCGVQTESLARLGKGAGWPRPPQEPFGLPLHGAITFDMGGRRLRDIGTWGHARGRRGFRLQSEMRSRREVALREMGAVAL